MVARHEILNIQVWNADASAAIALTPYVSVDVSARADLSIDTLSIVISDKHPAMQLLRTHRNIPAIVSFAVNGIELSGLVTALKQTKDGEVTVTVSGDTKHAARMLARARSTSAIDGATAQVEAPVGDLAAQMIGEAAQRTGLPVYILQEHEGDVVQVEIGSEDTIADVLAPVLESSDTFIDMRMLFPGEELPGTGDILRVQGRTEFLWEQDRLAAGAWPQAKAHARLKRAAIMPPTTPMPHLSWSGWAEMGETGSSVTKTRGVCWMPFDIGQHDRGYWQEDDNHGVRVATVEQLAEARKAGWFEHVTRWSAGTFGDSNDTALRQAIAAGLVVKTDGSKISSVSTALGYIGNSSGYAWFNGTYWVLADEAAYQAEDESRNPNITQLQTPGVLVHIHNGRDRRNEVLFSATDGGGLEDWQTTTTSPEAAMIHATTQLSQSTLEALQAGTAAIDPVAGTLTPGEASQYVGELPETVTAIDVNASPFSTVSGTDISRHHLGGAVNINAAGAFFYREMTTSTSSNSVNPVAEIGRAYHDAQGSTSIELTPGFTQTSVFGDDVVIDGRVIPGWKPGDRVSFTEGVTRISEVVAGFELHAAWDTPLRVTPVLSRADNGVLDTLVERLRRAERDAANALQQNPRRVPKDDVDTVVDDNETVKNTKQVAETANSAAGQAQRSADGKSTIFYGATAPTGAKAGDTWFKDVAGGGTVLMQFVNGRWVEKVNTKAIDDELAANQEALTELNDVALPALRQELEALDTVVAREAAEKLATLETKLADADKALKQDLQAELAALDEALTGDLATSLASLRDELEALDSVTASEVAAKLATLETKLANADKALKEGLQDDLAALDEALSGDLATSLTSLRSELEVLDADVASEAADNLAALETKLANADKALKQGLQGELAALDTALSGNLTSSLASLKEELEALDTAVALEAADNLATLETKLADADKALKQGLQGELNALDTALSGELTTSLASLKDELEAADTAAADAVATTLVQLENRLKSADQTLKTDLVAQLEALEADLAALDPTVGENLTERLESLRTELKQADTDVRTTLRGEISSLKTQLQGADVAIQNALTEQLATARKALEDADDAVTNDLTKKLEEARKGLKNASDAIADDLAEVDSVVSRQRPGNLFPDPFFADSSWTGALHVAENGILKLRASGAQSGRYYQPAGLRDSSIQFERGASYLMTADVRFGSTTGITYVDVYARVPKLDGTGIWTPRLGRINRVTSGPGKNSYAWAPTSAILTLPDDIATGTGTIGFFVQSAHPDGDAWLTNVRLTRAADNSLIIDGAVTAAKVKAGVIDTDHIAAGAIVATRLAADSVIAGKIATNAVVAKNIAAEQVTTAKLAADAVTANKIAADQILAKHVKSEQITTAKLAADAVTANKIAADAVTANAIKAGQVTTAKLAADAVTANKVAADAILARNIKSGQITTAKIAADAVTANEIASNQILAKHIKAGEITTAKLGANQVTTAKIAAGAVTADELQAENATIDKLWANGLVAKTVQTASLAVGAANLYRDPSLLDANSFGTRRSDTGGYGGGGSFTVAPSTATSGGYDTLGANTGRPTRLVPGVTYYVSAMVRPDRLVSSGNLRLYLRAYPTPDATGTQGWASPQWVSNKVSVAGGNWHRIEGTFKMHEEYEYLVLGFYVASGSQAQGIFSDPMVIRQHSTTMIADGAITTGKVAADAITANELAANSVTANAIKAGEVTAGKIASDAVSANKLLAEDATIDKLWANGIAAKSVTTNRILVANNGNLLPEITSYVGSDYPDPDPYEAFGKNSGHPSMWLKGRVNATINHALNLVAGQKYRFSYSASASVDGTRHYISMHKGNAEKKNVPTETFRNYIGNNSGTSAYVVSNQIINKAWKTFEIEITPEESGFAYLYIFANHDNGTTNDDGYQWFKDVRLEKMTGATLIEDGAITTDKIAADAVTANAIKADAVTANAIKSGEVAAKHLAADAVTANKLLAEDATIDKLWANGLAAKSITASRLTVSPGNMFPDPHFQDPSWGESSTGGIKLVSDGVQLIADGTQNGTYLHPEGQTSASMQHIPGVNYLLTVHLRFGGTADISRFSVYARYRRDTGDMGATKVGEFARFPSDGQPNASYRYNDNSTILDFSNVNTAPGGYFTLGFYVESSQSSGNVEIRNARLTPMSGTTLIEDGAVTTGKVAANAITANEIKADQVLAKHVKSDQILAKHVKSGEINAEHLLAEEATIDKLWANGLVAKAVQTSSLAVGPANLYRDPSLLDANSFDSRRSDTGGYGGGGSVTIAPSSSQVGSYDTLTSSRGRPTRLVPGATYYISVMVRPDRLVASDKVKLFFRAYPNANAAGSMSWATPSSAQNEVSLRSGEWARIEGTFVMPEGNEYLVLGFYVQSGASAQVVFSDPLIVRQYSSTMIQDGAITTGKVAANAITANELKANSVTANAIKAGEVTATKIASDAVSATKLLAEDATIDKLWANGIAAKSVVTNRVLVAGNGNMLPEVSTYAESSRPEIDPYPRPFGLNTGHPSIWVTGRSTAVIHHPLNLVAGQKYRFSYRVNASINNTRHFWQLLNGTADGVSAGGVSVKIGGSTSSYVINNEIANTSIRSYAVEFEAITTGTYYLQVYPNHTNGADNASGYQWFRDLRLEKMTGATLIEDGAVTTDKIAAGAVTAESIKAGEITSNHISSAKISSDKITVKNGFIKNAMIDNGEITNAKIANLDAGKITTGTINANRIGAKTIKGSHLDVDTIEANSIKANVFTQVANSVLPLIPGTSNPTWIGGLRYIARSGTKDAALPAGISGYYRHPSGTVAAGGNALVTNTYKNVVSVDPNLEYEASWWVRSSSGSPSHMYVTLEDENGDTSIVEKVEGEDENGEEYSKHTWGAPTRVIITSASTTWTKYTTLFKFKEGTKSARIHNIYFNNAGNSNAAYLYIAGLEISPHIIPQRHVDERQDKAIAKIQEYVDQMTGIFYSQSAAYAKKFNELSEPQSGGLIAGQNEDGVMTTTTSRIVCSGSWTGHILVHIMHKNDDGLSVQRHEVTGSSREFTIRSVSSVNQRPVAIHWFKRPGRAYAADMSRGAMAMNEGTWTTVASTTVATGAWNLSATVGWDAATSHSYYGVRARVAGSIVAEINPRSGLGPVIPIPGSGYRTQTISASGDRSGQTTTVEIQAYVNNASKASQRRIRRVNATLDWTQI